MVKASIVGASGYSGIELYKILYHHPKVKIGKLFANTSAGKKVSDLYPWFAENEDARFEAYDVEKTGESDLVFIALPSGEAMSIVPELLDRKKKVIDLGGDFRLLDISAYERYYGHQHSAPSYIADAVYGLPELNREQIIKAQFVANPGCYPTSALIPLIPLLKEGIVSDRGISINSMSGVSGAGRKSSIDLSFVEVNETAKAYKVGNHQHIPEIKSVLEYATNRSIGITFVPHLIPISRGIYTTITAPLKKNISSAAVEEIYQTYYKDEPFVRFLRKSIPEIRNVVYSNYIDFSFRIYEENDHLIILSAIDNLVKGAAGQAIQNMNLMFGYNETEGLK